MLLQRQKQIYNYCDITISGQCFSRLVFIAFRLWHKRLKWQRAYLQPHPSLLKGTWLFWKMAAHVETRTHLLSLCRHGDAIQVLQPSALKRGIYPAIFMAPSKSTIHPNAEVMAEILICLLESRAISYLMRLLHESDCF